MDPAAKWDTQTRGHASAALQNSLISRVCFLSFLSSSQIAGKRDSMTSLSLGTATRDKENTFPLPPIHTQLFPQFFMQSRSSSIRHATARSPKFSLALFYFSSSFKNKRSNKDKRRRNNCANWRHQPLTSMRTHQ